MVRLYTLEGRDLKGVVVIITGSSSGIGKEAAKALYKAGAHVIMACRSEAKTKDVIISLEQEIISETKGKLEFMKLEVSDLKSVQQFAKEFISKNLPLHLLINNAGIASGGKDLSPQGFEIIFATNHLGHFLLTELLMPKLKETADALKKENKLDIKSVRIVNVASKAHSFIRKPADFQLNDKSLTENGGSFGNYSRSKLANMFHAKELAAQLDKAGYGDSIKAFSLHPGVVATDIWRRFPSFIQWLGKKLMISEEEGAYTTLYCACSGEVETLSGEYFDDCAVAKDRSPVVKDEQLPKDLWKKSVELVKPFMS